MVANHTDIPLINYHSTHLIHPLPLSFIISPVLNDWADT